MSPARSKRQAALPHRRSRRDIVMAVAVAAVIVGVTSLLVWLMRPGPSGVPATGGLMNRQPRSSWLVGTAVGVAGLATWWILRSPRTRDRVKVVLPITLAVVVAATVAGGFLWPGGLLRHDVAPPPPAPTTTTTTTKTTKTTNGAGSTTTPAPTSPTTSAGSTTVPPTTTPAGATATTAAPASTSTTGSP